MRLFHRTWAICACSILDTGFIDGAENCVWMSDMPLDSDYVKGGNSGDVSLVVLISEEVVSAFPILTRNGYRAFKLPAEQLNMGKVGLNMTDYVGMSRDQLLERIKEREALEPDGKDVIIPGSKFGTAESLREALAFLDKFGPLA